MAAINTISARVEYHLSGGVPFVKVMLEKKRVAYTLIALENLRFGKINTVLLQDTGSNLTAKMSKNGKQYILSVMMKTLTLTENHIECVLSLLLDALSGTAFVGQHCDFAFPGLSLTVGIGE